jgi:hypothetical protein
LTGVSAEHSVWNARGWTFRQECEGVDRDQDSYIPERSGRRDGRVVMDGSIQVLEMNEWQATVIVDGVR